MGQFFNQLDDDHIKFIESQKIFFVATAAQEGHVNLSPKGMDTFRVIDKNTVAWLNLTGSGNETAAHVLKDPRMTIMFCSFDQKPLILRIYGNATMVQSTDHGWEKSLEWFNDKTGARQVFKLEVTKVQTSCGYGVPKYEFVEKRDLLEKWTNKRGPDELHQYWVENNKTSIDGYPTEIPEIT